MCAGFYSVEWRVMDSSVLELNLLVTVMGWAAGLVMLLLFILFVQDIFQSEHAVRRNFPLVGRLRYFLERQGEYFRQYFFAHDRLEMPFNRAPRSWIYRTAKGLGGMIGFGSSNDLREPGTFIFVNSPYPLLEEECEPTPPLVIGPDCEQPFIAESIFNISGMSFGALSAPAVRALSIGSARAGVWLNTGEGGLTPYHLEGGGNLIFQIGTAKYGVCDSEGRLDDGRLREVAQRVKAFEIKISQGAKPGRGGVLPAAKVTEEIARIRGIPAFQTASSPNRHREVKNPDDLLEMVEHIRRVTGRPVGLKAAIGSDLYPRMLCEAIRHRGLASAPDFITVDGGEGGSGAAPQVLMDHVSLPIAESLPMLVDVLHSYGLRERIRVIASGKLVTSANVAWALCAGADFVTSARGFMFSLGCIQSMQCHNDTCPTGITTHNPRLQKGLVVKDKASRVANYAAWVNHEVDLLAHACGLANAREFRREHVRIVQQAGKSLGLETIHPYPGPLFMDDSRAD
jgi:glutamate synthase domain-containing protein 2